MSDKLTETGELNKLIKEVRRGRGRPKKVVEVKKVPEPEKADSDIEIVEEVEAKPVKKVVQRRRKRASARLSTKPKSKSNAQKAKPKKKVTQEKAFDHQIADHQVSSTTASPLPVPVLAAAKEVEGVKANDREDDGRANCTVPEVHLPPEGQEVLNEVVESAGGDRNDFQLAPGLTCLKIKEEFVEDEMTAGPAGEVDTGDGNTENRENSAGSREGERIDSSACARDCFHARENEMLRSAVKELGRRNTIMEDFIELEFGEKYNKFLKTRQLLVKSAFEDVENQLNGERHSSSDEVVKILGFMRDAAVENKKEVEGISPKLESGGGSSAEQTKCMEKPNEASKSCQTSPSPPATPRAFTRFDASTKKDFNRPPQRQSEPARAPIQITLKKKPEPNLKITVNHKRPHSFASTQKDQGPPARSSESGQSYGKKLKMASELESPKFEHKSAATTPSQPDWQQKSASKVKQLISDVREKAAAAMAPSPPKLQQQKPISKYLNLLDTEYGVKYGTCPICNEIVKQKFLRDHLSVDHEPGLKCPDDACKEEFKTAFLYEEHVKLKHSLKASYTDIFKKDHVAEKFEWVTKKFNEGVINVPSHLQVMNAKSNQKQMKNRNLLGTSDNGLPSFSPPSASSLGGNSPKPPPQPPKNSAKLPPLQPPLPKEPPPPLPVPPPQPGSGLLPTPVQSLPYLLFPSLLQPQPRQGFISPHDPRRLARPRIQPGPYPFMPTSPPPPGTTPFPTSPNPFHSPGPSPFLQNAFFSPSKK